MLSRSSRTRLAASAWTLVLLFGYGAAPSRAVAQNTGVVTLPAPPGGAAAGPATVYRPADPTGTAASTARAAGPSGLMWKATSASNTVYLVGSIHFGSPDMYPLPAAMEDAFQSSPVLVVEIDLNKVNAMDALKIMAEQGMYPEGDTLWNHVSARTRQLLTRFCEARGYSAGMFARMKPWAANLTMSSLVMQAAGLKPDLGIDMHFLKQARDGKRVEQLESMEQQMRMFAKGSAAEQERSLAEAVESFDRFGELGQKLKEAWLSGDAPAIDELMASSFAGSPESRQTLLGDRNPHMAAEVERYLKGGEQALVIVGAAHLIGKDGIVNSLRQKGFKVQQVLSSN